MAIALVGLNVSVHAVKVTRSYQVSVGVPFTLDPAVDLGLTRTAVTSVSGMLYENTRNAFTTDKIIYTTTVYDGYGKNSGHYFTITPQKTGTISFLIVIGIQILSIP